MKRPQAFATTAVTLLTAALFPFAAVPNAKAATDNTMRDISTMALVRDMGVGINLGNTMESCGDWIAQWGDGSVASYETDWGSNFPEDKEECMLHFTRFWEQIYDGFEHYGDKLMFEAQNEEFGWNTLYNQWGGASDKEGSYALVNDAKVNCNAPKTVIFPMTAC